MVIASGYELLSHVCEMVGLGILMQEIYSLDSDISCGFCILRRFGRV